MWRAEGLQKSGKTLVMAGISFAFGYGAGYNVFTNMSSCKYRGVRWATTITLDQLLRQMAETDKSKWWIKDGFLLIDEAPTWFLKGGQSTSNVSQMLARCSVQLMKRNIKLIYTAHLINMIPDYLDALTEVVFECKTDDGGQHIAFKVYDNQHRIECARYKYPWGEWDKAQWWVPGPPFFDLYDYEEAMDIFATDRSDFAGASGRRRSRQLLPDDQRQQQYPNSRDDIAVLTGKVSELQGLLIKGSNGALPRMSKADRLREQVGAL